MARRFLIAASIVALLTAPATAALPVIDAAALARWAQQAQQMEEELTQLQAQVRMMQDIPRDLITQAEQLMNTGIQNPLQNIMQNIRAMMTGQSLGTCGGAKQVYGDNQYMAPLGGDFTSAWLNQSSTRNAGLYACSQQMLEGTQARLASLPGLLNQLQGATDQTQATAISGRIQYEIANVNAQNQQIAAMYQMSEMQHRMADDQVLQKMRSDAQERINATSGGAGGGGILAPVVGPAPFMAGN